MSKPEEQSELRQIMIKIQVQSKVWLAAKSTAEQLEGDAGPYLDALKNALADGKKSEAQISREARGSDEYRKFIKGMVAASMDALYEQRRLINLERWWETARSEMALTRETVKHGIFSEGG